MKVLLAPELDFKVGHDIEAAGMKVESGVEDPKGCQ